MRVIIAGGRDFNDYELLNKKCDIYLAKLNKDKLVIISGGALGTDRLGERYAKEHGYTLRLYPANWDLHGKKAGYLRNKQMAQDADTLIAFWDNKSKGTQHMIQIADKAGLKLRVVLYNQRSD